MKLFRTILKNFSFLGINPAKYIGKNPFNKKVLMVYFSCVITVIFYSVYLDEAKSFEESTEIAYRISVVILLAIQLTAVVLRVKNLSELLVNSQEVLEESEYSKA